MKTLAKTLLVSGLLLGGMSMALARVATAEPMAMKFNVYVSGLKAMRVTFHGALERKGYAGVADMKPKGLAGLFVKKKLHMEVKGRFNDRHAYPVRFTIRTKKKGREKAASVQWDGKGRIVGWERRPPLGVGQRQEVRAALAGGAIDPLSMLFAIGVRTEANPCAGKMRLFDGLTVFDIRMAGVGQDRVRSGTYRGPALKCRLVYVPVAGMSESKKRKRLNNPPVFTVWLARVRSAALGPIWVPVQAAGRLKGRPFTASLAAATLNDAPLVPASR